MRVGGHLAEDMARIPAPVGEIWPSVSVYDPLAVTKHRPRQA